MIVGQRDTASFWVVYTMLLHRLLAAPAELNERTGTRVSIVPGGCSFNLNLADRLLPTCGLRRTYPKVAAAEVAWFLSGQRDVTWMRQHAPIWDKFVEKLLILEGDQLGHPDLRDNLDTARIVTEVVGEGLDRHRRILGTEFDGVEAAYGYRWRCHFERDQIALAIQALRANPSDRRVVVSAWDPAQDGLGALDQKNVPCPAMFTLSIVGGRLHSTMLLRSSDVFVGLPYDVLGHALLLDALALELGVELGIATFTLAHAHLYECHWDMAREALKQQPEVPAMPLPGWTVTAIEDDRDGYVRAVREATKGYEWPTFRPQPEVVA